MQAARGASLNSDPHSPSRHRRLLVVFGLVAAVAYLVDQVTKVLAVNRLESGDKVQVVGDLLTLTLVRNPGAAFGTGTEYTWVFTCLSVIAAAVVVVVVRRVGSLAWAVGLGLLLAGVVGNLTDRVLREPQMFHGHVVDFLQLPNWPVFNVADICINVAAGLIILQAFRGIGLDGTREVSARTTGSAAPTRDSTTEGVEPTSGSNDEDPL